MPLFTYICILIVLNILFIMCKSDVFHDETGNDIRENRDYTPSRANAFARTDEEKLGYIRKDVENIVSILGMNLTGDSQKGTSDRVAKMFVKEIFGGLNPAKKPSSYT